MFDSTYKKAHTKLRRELRANATEAERILWNALRKRQMLGYKFRRQAAIGRHIADFYCAEQLLVIELDGQYHDTHKQTTKDKTRDEYFAKFGIEVLRFKNAEIEQNLPYCIAIIKDKLAL